jgi:hypothetical protein
LVYQIKTGDLYRDMLDFKEEFDTSNYPKDHPLYTMERNTIPPFMKDEYGGKLIKEFVGLAPKMYAVSIEKKSSVKAKGVSKLKPKRWI